MPGANGLGVAPGGLSPKYGLSMDELLDPPEGEQLENMATLVKTALIKMNLIDCSFLPLDGSVFGLRNAPWGFFAPCNLRPHTPSTFCLDIASTRRKLRPGVRSTMRHKHTRRRGAEREAQNNDSEPIKQKGPAGQTPFSTNCQLSPFYLCSFLCLSNFSLRITCTIKTVFFSCR